ncbi:hypothetical protein ABT010_38025 [Streptomyces sp. NPDC002668]
MRRIASDDAKPDGQTINVTLIRTKVMNQDQPITWTPCARRVPLEY